MKYIMLLFALVSLGSAEEAFIPKYGPVPKAIATQLKQERSYVQKNVAPDFWALIPYYVGMHVDNAASPASLAMVLNGLRQNTRYSSSDEMMSAAALLKKVKTHQWAQKLAGKKPIGVTLPQFADIAQAATAAYGLPTTKTETIPVADATPATVEKVRKLLIENEKNDQGFLIAHYMQSAFTADPEGAVGTFSPVGAYDAKNDRVLILETDRKYYEPYWVSTQVFVEGLAGLVDSKTKLPRGGLLSMTSVP